MIDKGWLSDRNHPSGPARSLTKHRIPVQPLPAGVNIKGYGSHVGVPSFVSLNGTDTAGHSPRSPPESPLSTTASSEGSSSCAIPSVSPVSRSLLSLSAPPPSRATQPSFVLIPPRSRSTQSVFSSTSFTRPTRPDDLYLPSPLTKLAAMDFKNSLQHVLQKRFPYMQPNNLVRYNTVSSSFQGIFVSEVEILVTGQLARGSPCMGKKAAEQKAAENALALLTAQAG